MAVSKPPQVVTVDATKTEVGRFPWPDPRIFPPSTPNPAMFTSATTTARNCGCSIPRSKVTSTVELPSDAPEDLGFDATFQRLFQALKSSSVITVIDVAEL